MKTGIKLLVILSLLFLFQTCSDGDPDPQPIDDTQKTLPAHWADVTLEDHSVHLSELPYLHFQESGIYRTYDV